MLERYVGNQNAMKVLIVYVGQGSLENYDHGLRHGLWGFKPSRSQNAEQIQIGDYILFGRGFDGGSPRIPEDQWRLGAISELAWGRVTRELQLETLPEWPDEERDSRVIYPYRLRFGDVQRLNEPTPLSGQGKLPLSLSDALRRSAITNSGYLEELTSWPLDGEHEEMDRNMDHANEESEDTEQLRISDTLIEIENYISSRGFVFSGHVLRAFYASLRSKPFVILAGNSGTGKSRLVRLFAEASGATVENGRFTMIPVRPDWNDSSELLGYFDLNGEFNPGHLISTILMAHHMPERPFFVCLDEMNLAKVEHYFSDFLSIVESRRRSGEKIVTDPILSQAQLNKMKLDGLRSEAGAAANNLISSNQPVGLPENLFVFGTVNMDETTQPFSRKVLDRAHTLEFNDIDLMQGLDEQIAFADVPALDLHQSFFSPEFTCLNDILPKHREKAKEVAKFVNDLNTELAAAGFEVGYRVRDEAISFAVYAAEAGLAEASIGDAIVLQKILPRIHGSSPRVGKLLYSLLQKLKGDIEAPQIEDPNFDQRLAELRGDGDTSMVVRKIAGMLLVFREENFTSFWLV
ncbi:MAG: AAA family ATPase [Acidobacteria bacterium]|nr:AAA family ATPase [Acidobacteriota bacterium]